MQYITISEMDFTLRHLLRLHGALGATELHQTVEVLILPRSNTTVAGKKGNLHFRGSFHPEIVGLHVSTSQIR